MTKIAKIVTLDNSRDFINIIKDKDLLIYEDVVASKILVNWDGNKFIIKAKSIKNDPLNFVDLAVQKFYNKAYNYFKNLPEYITELLNTNWWFCFEYFPDENPSHVEYNRVPKNNLILTCIVKGKRYVYDFDEINEYSKLFEIDPLPVIFKGKLSAKQLEVIELYLNTKEDDLKYVFGEENFAYFFYKILNPKIESSFLMDSEFNNNLEKFIIKIDNNSKYSFEILNPLYRKMELNNDTQYTNIYTLILIKFMEHFQLIDLKTLNLNSVTKEELYIELICEIFNDFILKSEDEIISWNIHIPSFFKEDKFKINTDLIDNEETKILIKSNEKIEYIFKCCLGSFNKKRKKAIGYFTDNTLDLFNNTVKTINSLIDDILKINLEYSLNKDDLKNFKDYFKLNYDTDSTGEIYPDMYDEFTDDEDSLDKKKKKKLDYKKGFDDFDQKIK